MRIPVLMFDFGNVIGFFDYSAMFHRFGQRLGLSAKQFEAMSCVFIDDAPANVEGAPAAGLKAVHYRDTPTLIAELRRLGVELPDSKG
jgi:FMN phosphatase YigB (HAD superfamily)